MTLLDVQKAFLAGESDPLLCNELRSITIQTCSRGFCESLGARTLLKSVLAPRANVHSVPHLEDPQDQSTSREYAWEIARCPQGTAQAPQKSECLCLLPIDGPQFSEQRETPHHSTWGDLAS